MTRDQARGMLRAVEQRRNWSLMGAGGAVGGLVLQFTLWPTPPFPRGLVLCAALLIVAFMTMSGMTSYYISQASIFKRDWNI